MIEEQQVSGINMKKFCREKDLPYYAFKNHKQASKVIDSKTASFLPVKQEVRKNVEFRINGNLVSFDDSFGGGLSLPEVAKLMGHEQLSIPEIYAETDMT